MIACDVVSHALCDELADALPSCRLFGAWVYGSHARGEARADSDLDIALLCDRKLDAPTLCDRGTRPGVRLGVPVDPVNPRRAGCRGWRRLTAAMP